FTDSLQVYDWYREPDYKDNYREMFELCNRLSDKPIKHFELVSFWRLVRDEGYVKWLSSLGVKTAQLTLFGDEEATDFYVGRKGAYREILRSVDILMENRITPRIQVFVNKNNIAGLSHIEELIKRLDLDNRCRKFGGEFSFFLHQGSCDGENEKLYSVRVTPDDMAKIPKLLEAYTLKHFGKESISEVFGQTEQSLYNELITDNSTADYVSDSPVFYIDKDFNVYPNVTAPAAHWCLGNLKKQGTENVLRNYLESKSPSQNTRLTVPICDIVKACGDKESLCLFGKGDYIIFLLNKFCRQ
ncbi:MAG: radical SAM protein, partial [Oscillospiraceae bacterium]|nr:radical SAM protein [Oscillospiraceae bacterium]